MKVKLLIVFLFLSALTFGQKQSISINYKPSLTFLGKQNQEFQHYYFKSRKGDLTFKSAANILYTYQLFNRLSLTAGLEYAQQGQNIHFDTATQFGNGNILKIELNYLRIPFTINYTVIKETGWELIAYSGISLGLVTKRHDNYQNMIMEAILLAPSEQEYKDQDWAIPMGVTYKKELTSNLSASFNLEYLLGITNAFSEKRFGVLSQFDNSKQSRLSVGIGISYNLGK